MNRNFVNRLLILKIFFVLIFVIFTIRLFQLQIIQGENYLEQANIQQQKESILLANRGKILVRKNRYTAETTSLATNNTLQKIFVDPLVINYPAYDKNLPIESQEKGNPAVAAKILAPILIHSHCEKIEGCTIESNPDKWTSTQKITIGAYQKELEKLFREIYRRRIVLLTEISDSRATEIETMNLSGISIEKNSVIVDPLQITDIKMTAEKLSPLLGITNEKIENSLEKSFNRYQVITEKVVPEVSEKIRELQSSKEYYHILRGIGLEPQNMRFYPEKELAAQVLGFLDSKGTGQYGIEGHFDRELKGKEGKISGATNTSGKRIFGEGIDIKRSEDGVDIVLTIDRIIQGEVEKILVEDLEKFQADFGQVIVVDPKTGKIMAMAQVPTFDPNNVNYVYNRYEISIEQEEAERDEETSDFNQRIPTVREQEKIYRYLNKWGAEVLRNKIITDEYEPGSVIKALTMAAAIQTGEISPTTTYEDTGPVEVDEFKIRNSDEIYEGKTTMVKVLSRSLNTGIAFVTQKMGSELVHLFFKNFGFGQYTDIEFDGETSGRLEFWQSWSDSELVTRGFGQGFTATPLQVAMAFASLANGGYLMKPILVEEIIYSDETIDKKEPERIRRILSNQTTQTIKTMLLSAVNRGTGLGARNRQHQVMGKTGTSQTYKNGKILTGLGTTITSFVGMGPYADPQFIILVKYDYPKTSQWGSETAAITFRRISEFLFEYLQIPPDKN